MSAQTGTINVTTENIFPIIKKFLYSDHEIFLRELISNATDATQKLKTLAIRGEETGDISNPKITVSIDKEKGTLTIADEGIGMTKDEVKKYINQIAFSGASEFLEKYKDENAIIGKFGLGFYSAFMVASKVEVHTKSYRKGTKSAHWSCDGSPNYELNDGDKTERGTAITLHIDEDSKEFLEEGRIHDLLNKYCRFLPVEIVFGTEEETVDTGKKDKEDKPITKTVSKDRIINNTKPAWTKPPSELTDEDYKAFYKELYPGSLEEPLFWIHLNVDYPFNLTGILYFPKLKNQQMEVKKDKIHLYSNQVYVTDQVEEIVPEFLMLLHGVIDSPDIPLNVSRSYLQSDSNVKKISSYITKKVAAKLGEMFKQDRAAYEAKWDDIGIFIKYGILSDDKFKEKAKNIVLHRNMEDNFFTFDEYKEKIKDAQTDKNEQLVMLYTNLPEQQHSYIDGAKERGYDVLKMNTIIDSHFVSFMEQEYEKVSCKRVDADILDNLIETDEEKEVVLSDDEQTALKDLFSTAIGDSNVTVEVKAMSPNEFPVLITRPEFMRRMKEMQAYNFSGGDMPDFYNLILNGNHPKVKYILDTKKEEKKAELVHQMYDLALLSQNMLKGDKLTAFLKRSVDLVE